MKEWDKVEEWRKQFPTFCVSVKHHTVDYRSISGEGPHRWCVYAYLYPDHPHFAAFEGDRIFQDAARAMPFHWGPTFLQWHRDGKGEIGSVQVGADYGHIHDQWFTHLATADDAREVFADAEKLIEWLQAFEEPPPPPIQAEAKEEGE